jgi:molybdopterin-binding protein
MKLSARNKLKGKIIAIEEGLITAKVKIDLGNGNEIVSIISRDAITDLKLKVNNEAYAIIKSTEVIVGIPCDCESGCCKCNE